MNDIMTATPPAHRGKGYYLRRIFQQMPAVSANSGYPTAVLLAKYALYHIFERTEFEDFRALRLYEYNHRRRRDFLLTCHVMHFSDILNAQATPEQVARVDDKHLFDQTFRNSSTGTGCTWPTPPWRRYRRSWPKIRSSSSRSASPTRERAWPNTPRRIRTRGS